MITLVMMPEHSCTLPSSGENMGNISWPSLYSAPGYNPSPRHVCAMHPDYRSAVVRSILRTQFLRGSEASPWSRGASSAK